MNYKDHLKRRFREMYFYHLLSSFQCKELDGEVLDGYIYLLLRSLLCEDFNGEVLNGEVFDFPTK